jgi:hypothetical protein
MQSKKKKSAEEVFARLLQKVKAAELRSFLVAEAKQNHLLRHSLLIHFLETSGMAAEEKYELLIRSVLELSAWDKSRYHGELERYFAKAKGYADSRDYLDAFLMASAYIMEFPRWETDQNESRLPSCFELLSTISTSDAAFDLKERVFDFLLQDVKAVSSNFSFEDHARWLRTLISSAAEDAKLLQVLNLLAELIGNNRSQYGEAMNEKQEEQFLEMKLEVLKLLNRPQEVRRLLEANKRIKPFRLELISECMKHHQWDEAKDLIKEGRRRESVKGSINVSSEWDEMLLTIARKEGDVKAIRNLSMQLFLSSEYDFNYYRLMKQHYDPSRWNLQAERLVNAIKKERSYSTKGIHAVAKIFIEEEEWEKLLTLLDKNASLDFVGQYADQLRDKFPEPLLEIYRKAIRRFAEKYMGPEAYRIVAASLRKMLLLPKSKEIVQSLTIELKVNYRSRRAFVEELNKVML